MLLLLGRHAPYLDKANLNGVLGRDWIASVVTPSSSAPGQPGALLLMGRCAVQTVFAFG
jgi:hypothetical protein